MKFFVDTADTKEIKALAASGLLDGVTTNPTLMAKSGRKFQDVHGGDLRHRAGTGQRRGGGDRYDGMMAEAGCCGRSPRTSR